MENGDWIYECVTRLPLYGDCTIGNTIADQGKFPGWCATRREFPPRRDWILHGSRGGNVPEVGEDDGHQRVSHSERENRQWLRGKELESTFEIDSKGIRSFRSIDRPPRGSLTDSLAGALDDADRKWATHD